jgi:hypothetical protein
MIHQDFVGLPDAERREIAYYRPSRVSNVIFDSFG